MTAIDADRPAIAPAAISSASSPHGTYRPDIDGLRAIAVLSVIVFHISRSLLPGGFVGVDIFFVISGYLITSHIVHDVDRGTFSLPAFYARRVKRIAPAMLVVVGVTVIAAKLLMVPEDAADASKSAVWSLSSMANVFFWRYQDTGYFAAQGRDLPLLHLWSLGVEEQFYLFWPLLLLLFYRPNRVRGFLLGASLIAAGSFLLGDLIFARSPAFAYYMLPTRAGELLLGAIATNPAINQRWTASSRRFRTLVSVLAVLTLAASLVLLRETATFPGVLAVPPTLATALLILTGTDPTQAVSRSLSFPLLVPVGLISYSAYLWHWPLLTFYRYGYGDAGTLTGFALLAATLLLAWLSYRYVEQPARRTRAAPSSIFMRQYFVPAAAIGACALGVTYGDRVWPSLLETPYRTRLVLLRDQTRPAYEYSYVCERQRVAVSDIVDQRCVVGDSAGSDSLVVLWGDSNAAHYVGVLGAFAREAQFRFRNVEVGSCPPLFIDPRRFVDARRESDCVVSAAIVRPVIDRASVVVISSAWTAYQARSATFLPTFYSLVRDLSSRGKRVILLGKAPVFDGFDRRCREKSLGFPLMHCSVMHAPIDHKVAEINTQLEEFAANTPGVQYYDVNRYLCPQRVCSTHTSDGQPLYYDASHLSLAGSWLLGRLIVERDGVPVTFRHLSGSGIPGLRR
jgi:peptidoglycan/LPS O-acetylase OafA/YrhL